MKDREGRYLLVNDAAARILGRPAGEILGRTDHELMPESAADSLRRADLRTIAAGIVLTHLERIPGPDGDRVFQSNKGVFRTAQGETAGVFGISRDVTFETKVGERERFLSEASAILAGSLDHEVALAKIAADAVPLLGDAVLVHLREPDRELRLVEAVFPDPSLRAKWRSYEERFDVQTTPRSPAGRELVLTTGRSVVHRLEGEALRSLPIPSDRKQAILDLGIRSAAIVPIGAAGQVLGTMSFLALSPDRRIGEADLPFLEELGRRAGAAVHAAHLYVEAQREIARRREAEAELARKAEDLARSNAELEQFAYVASHDLQEPLRNVASYTQLLARRYRGQLDEQADRYVDYAVDRALRMQTLIQDLLAYSRAGRSSEAPAPFPLGEALATATANLEKTLEEMGARVLVTTDLPEVRAARTQLTQVFQNLIGNAVKFRSAAPPEVRVSARRLGREWEIAVEDNGIGFEPIHADRVFVIFQRLHARDVYPGSGIGLAICKRIVEQHGGRIRVESAVGKGTTFLFTLPA